PERWPPGDTGKFLSLFPGEVYTSGMSGGRGGAWGAREGRSPLARVAVSTLVNVDHAENPLVVGGPPRAPCAMTQALPARFLGPPQQSGRRSDLQVTPARLTS